MSGYVPAMTEKTASFGFREVPEGEKEGLVKEVFSSVAARYDLMNDLMSGGLHRAWKDALVTAINPPTKGRPGRLDEKGDADFKLLDVAGGTGDVSFRTIDAGGYGTRAHSRTEPSTPTRARPSRAGSGSSLSSRARRRAASTTCATL